MGLMDSLNIGNRGLNASQVGIDVTGQNISNANTDGYSRKRVNQVAETVGSELFGQVGMGVDVQSIGRVRNEFLDRQTWEQLGESGTTSQLDTAYTRLENILKEPSADGLAAQLNKFWSSWQDLANNPADQSTREAVKASANVLVDVFRGVYKQIDDYGMSMNNPLDQMSKNVNDLTGQIKNLNDKIAGVEATPDQKANDSRDQRDTLVRKLASLVDVQTVEDKQGRIIITSGGSLLVGPSGAMNLQTYGVNQTLADGSKSTELRLRFEGTVREFIPRSGELKGIIDARSTVLTSYKDSLNALAAAIVKKVNDVHTAGYNLNKSTGVNFFDPGKTNASNITLSDAVIQDSNNIAAAAGGKITDITLPVAPFATLAIPVAGTPTLVLKPSLVSGSVKLTDKTTGAVLTEGAGKDFVVDYASGTVTFLNYAKYTAGDVLSGTYSYNDTGYSGDGNGQNALTIAGLRDAKALTKDADGNFTQSINTYYSAVIGKMGIEKNQNAARKSTSDFLVSQMDQEQSASSGVSLDEEMTNLIKYQNSYKASAKFIQTVSQMIEVLMGIQ